MPKEPRVLSIQSYVVHGFVGNKCSQFVFQALDVPVDPLLTCQLSNHTGYSTWRGRMLGAEELWELFEGLVQNNFASSYTHLLCGYCQNTAALKQIVRICDHLKRVNPALEFVVDPVLGDAGRLYVPQANVDVYRHFFLCRADIILPNQTELEFLTDRTIGSEKDAVEAIQILHEGGIPTVVVTSLSFHPSSVVVIGHCVKKGEEDSFRISVPLLDGYYSGTGDLFASLFLAWMNKGCSFRASCERSVCTIQAILERTRQASSLELLVSKSLTDIVSPPTNYYADTIT